MNLKSGMTELVSIHRPLVSLGTTGTLLGNGSNWLRFLEFVNPDV